MYKSIQENAKKLKEEFEAKLQRSLFDLAIYVENNVEEIRTDEKQIYIRGLIEKVRKARDGKIESGMLLSAMERFNRYLEEN
jgi:flagellar biosynthesis regulator FlaF